MKEATGELNMTVVTLIAVAALGALFYFVVWPMVQRMIVQQTCNTYGTTWHAVKAGTTGDTGTQAEVGDWYCCPSKDFNKDTCIHASNEADVNADNSGK